MKQWKSIVLGGKKAWRLWALSLGERAGDSDKEADTVALIRTTLAVINVLTCFLISFNILHQWGII